MKLLKSLTVAALISGVVSTFGFADGHMAKKGEKIFLTKNLGNCLACHAVNGREDIQKMGPGSFGPKLTGLKYWDEKTLYDTVYDIYSARDLKISPMPAFGKAGWLSDEEIKAVVAFLKTID
jgi:sulfur-oxidizing protein SoxX